MVGDTLALLADGIRAEGQEARTLWWATKNEWLGLIDSAGLKIEALYGGFDGVQFDDDSSEYVFITRRP